jgi:FkbM family methyltransferase
MHDSIKRPGQGVVIPNGLKGRVGRKMLRGSWYEGEMLDYISGLRLNGVYLDVGANIGNHTAYFAINTMAEHVVSFEPLARVRGTLLEIIDMNKLWFKVTVIPRACSLNEDGIMVMENDALDVPPVMHPSCLIDDVVDLPVSLVKIDIEGSEPAALKGALKTLQKYKPVLFVESHSAAHFEEILAVIQPIGYIATGKVWNASPTYEFVYQK